MNKLKIIITLILGQYLLTFISLNTFSEDVLIGSAFTMSSWLLVPLLIGISIAAFRSIASLDKMFLKHMVQHEISSREHDIDHYQEEMNIIQHEVLRDIQMITVLAENKNYDEVEKYLSK